jgi:alpha 1,6-mannosyltransferase
MCIDLADIRPVNQETAANSVSSQTKEELVHSGEESPSPTHTSPSFTQIDLSPTLPIQTWGLDLSSDKLLAGLAPWPENPPYDAENTAPLSSLGHFADNIYKIGPITLAEYTAQLTEFASVAFPDKIKQKLLQGLSAALSTTSEDSKTRSSLANWRSVKKIWQTDKDSSLKDSAEVQSWRRGKAFDEGWDWSLMTDK